MERILYLYEPAERRFRRLPVSEHAQMPCVERLRFPVSAFARGAEGDLLWTDRRALVALDALAKDAGFPFEVDCGFRRQPMGGRALLCHHAAGTAFDVGRSLPPGKQNALRLLAVSGGLFRWVEMPYASGTLLRLSLVRRFPALEAGFVGPYVLLLQDLLLRAGAYRGPLTGVFSEETERGVRRAERLLGLPATGRFTHSLWRPLVALTNAGTNAKMVLQIGKEQGSD